MKKLFSLSLLLVFFTFLDVYPQSITHEGKRSEQTAQEMIYEYDQQVQSGQLSDQKGWKAYGRWVEFMRERLGPDGEPADPAIFLEQANIVANEKAQASRLKTGQAWSPVGPFEMPGTYSSSPIFGMGRINCISFHPTDPQIYWIGVAQGGVWKTTDGGESYIPLTDDLPILRVSDIAVDPNDPDIIYLSVCDYAYIGVALNTDQRKRHTHYGLGVYKTTNGGNTWEPTGLSFSQSELDVTLIRRVLISPDDSNHLLAAGVNGMYKSTDGGDAWTRIREDLFWDIEQDFTNGNTIYATTGHVWTMSRGQASLIKSEDFGETWTELNPDFPGDQSISRVEIGLTPETPDYIYLVAADPDGGFFGFYRSTDGGSSWETRKHHSEGQNILHWYQSASGAGGQGWYDLAILVDPKDKERVFVGGINMWGSEDGGQNWEMCSYWVMSNGFTLHADHHQYKYNPLDEKYYACHDGGVARTSKLSLGADISGKWDTNWEERSNGMAITSFYRIGLSENNPGYVIGGAQDNSTYYNQDGVWLNMFGGDGMESLIHPDDPDIIYGSSQYGNLSRSTNGGRSTNGIRPTYDENGGWTTPLIMHPNNPDELYCGFGNVWKSENQGTSWTRISNFPVVDGYGYPAIISALAIYASDPKYIYTAKRIHHPFNSPSSFWRTSDGAHWENVSAGLPDSLYFSYIAIDDNDPFSVWVTCSGFLDDQKVYHTADGGSTWDNISLNLPNVPANTIVHQNGSENNLIYVGTDAGVYYTWDNHMQWELYSTDMPNVIVSELEIHYSTNKIYAATFGRGIWMAELASATSSSETVENINSLLIYPNPTSGSLFIDYSGLPSGQMTVDVADIQGKTVFEKIVTNNSGQGNIKIDIDVKPGVYFVRLKAGTKLRTSRIIIE